MKGKYKIFLLCLSIMLVLCFIVSASYAYYMFGISQSGYNAIVGECFRLSFNEGDALNIGDAIPISEEEAQEIVPFSFSIKNVCSYDMAYNINIETLENNTMDLDAIRVKLDNDESAILGSLEDNGLDYYANSNAISSKKVGTGYISAGEEKSFQIKAWIDEDATYEQSGNKMFVSKVVVSARAELNSKLASGFQINKAIKKLAGFNPTQDEINDYNTKRELSIAICNGDYSSISNGSIDWNEYISIIASANNSCDELALTYNTNVESIYWTHSDRVVKHIVMADVLPENITEMQSEKISSDDSKNDIIMWLDDDTIYIYTVDEKFATIDSSYMFAALQVLEDIDFSKFDTSYSENMSFMFYKNYYLTDLELSDFDTSNVKNMMGMFYNSSFSKIDVSHFDTSSVTDMSFMFSNINGLYAPDLSNFDTSQVVNMAHMFDSSSWQFQLDLSKFDTSNVTNMSCMFYKLHVPSVDISNFDTSNVKGMRYMFANSSITSLDVSSFNTSKVVDMGNMFSGLNMSMLDISNFDTSNVLYMDYMFKGCNLESIDFSSFNTSSVIDMSGMFSECGKLTTLDLSYFNTSSVQSMMKMFSKMSLLTSINFGDHFDTSNVIYMNEMFSDLTRLESLDLSFFNTSNVRIMESMFNGASGLVNLNVSSFDTSKVTSMSSMFAKMDSIVTLDLSSFDTSSVTQGSSMFEGSSSGSSLKTIYVGANWKSSTLSKFSNVFKNLTNIVGGAGTVYNSSKTSGTYARVDDPANNKPGYLTLKTV
ncbi:MAG: BspA family leucine-rich repeat surface protein [Firmicutes bacterium]|nr:BspA family leucine-rich repeat surface protein [Bacillota bacterium]